jgi:hypothetical protein
MIQLHFKFRILLYRYLYIILHNNEDFYPNPRLPLISGSNQFQASGGVESPPEAPMFSSAERVHS